MTFVFGRHLNNVQSRWAIFCVFIGKHNTNLFFQSRLAGPSLIFFALKFAFILSVASGRWLIVKCEMRRSAVCVYVLNSRPSLSWFFAVSRLFSFAGGFADRVFVYRILVSLQTVFARRFLSPWFFPFFLFSLLFLLNTRNMSTQSGIFFGSTFSWMTDGWRMFQSPDRISFFSFWRP